MKTATIDHLLKLTDAVNASGAVWTTAELDAVIEATAELDRRRKPNFIRDPFRITPDDLIALNWPKVETKTGVEYHLPNDRSVAVVYPNGGDPFVRMFQWAKGGIVPDRVTTVDDLLELIWLVLGKDFRK